MRIRGVSFEMHMQEKYCICDLLNGLEIEKYDWIIDDLWIDDVDENVFLKEGRYDGKTFRKLASVYNNITFAKIIRIPRNCSLGIVENYEDYINQSCTLVILCTDGAYYDIYNKNINESIMLYESLSKMDLHNVEYITDENDCRTSF